MFPQTLFLNLLGGTNWLLLEAGTGAAPFPEQIHLPETTEPFVPGPERAPFTHELCLGLSSLLAAV